MTDPPQVFRPAVDIVYTGGGGSITFLDVDGTVRTRVGTQPDGSVTAVDFNAPAPAAPSTPVLAPTQLGMTVSWDGLLASDSLGSTLNANTDFESGVDPWGVADSGAIAQSGTQFHGGSHSLACTPDGTSAVISAGSELIRVVAGLTYEAATWVWATDAVTAQFTLGIAFYDNDGTLLSTDGAPSDLPAATWAEVITTATAPSGTVFAQIHPSLAGTPTDVFYLDDITLAEAQSSVPADFDHVEIHVDTTTGFTPADLTRVGTLRKSGSFVATPLIAGTTYYAVLVPVNTSGISGTPSAQASATPTQVVATDITDGIVTTLKLADDAVTNAKIADTAVDANKLADNSVDAAKILNGSVGTSEISFSARDIGGITTTIAGSAPSAPLTSDIWIDSSNGFRLNRWTGTAWVAIQYGTNALSAGSVTAAVIAANTITAAQIAGGTITATQISAGAIGATQLAANSVIAGKIAAGIVDTTALAANAVTAAKIAANTITASQIAANTITASQIASGTITATQIAANAIDATKLAATLILASTIIAGTSGGPRLQLDSTGLNAFDGLHTDPTVSITNLGDATFSGSNVSAASITASSVEIDAGPSGALVMYGVSGGAVNANPDFTSNITNWSADAANPSISFSYSSTHLWNSHDTLRIVGAGSGPVYLDSELFTITSGDTYTVDVTALCEGGMSLQVILQLDNSIGGVLVSDSQFLPGPRGSFQRVSFSVPDDTGSAVKGRIKLAVSGGTNAVYVGRAGATLVDPVQVMSMAAAAGTDNNGNAFPAGFAIQGNAAVGGNFSAGNIDWGRVPAGTQTVGGTVTVTHTLNANPNVAIATMTGSANNKFKPFWSSSTTSTITFGFIDTTTGAVTGLGGQAAVFSWFAAV